MGYGDIVPHSDIGRLITCLFMILGVSVVAGCFVHVMNQFLFVHRDTALKERVERRSSLPLSTEEATESGIKAIMAMLERRIQLSYSAALWMCLELLVLIFFGVAIIYTVEDWNFPDTLYWSVQTIFAVGYGDFTPVTTAGRWVTTFFMIIGCFIVINILASFATLPGLYHQRASERLILGQFVAAASASALNNDDSSAAAPPPSPDDATAAAADALSALSSSSTMEELKQTLLEARMSVPGGSLYVVGRAPLPTCSFSS